MITLVISHLVIEDQGGTGRYRGGARRYRGGIAISRLVREDQVRRELGNFKLFDIAIEIDLDTEGQSLLGV